MGKTMDGYLRDYVGADMNVNKSIDMVVNMGEYMIVRAFLLSM